MLEKHVKELERAAAAFVWGEAICAAAGLSGDGCCGQGWRDPACDVGRESAGLRGVELQAAERGGAGARLSVALDAAAAGAGRIGIFNRSYYEEVLVVRVHPELLASEGLAEEKRHDKDFWEQRYRSIVDMEKHLYRNGTRIVKIFLHLSKEEQKKRFLARIDEPDKNWKFSMADIHERKYWKQYQDCV